eukprot:2806894-Pleurochrysis_carterae.AAC.1
MQRKSNMRVKLAESMTLPVEFIGSIILRVPAGVMSQELQVLCLAAYADLHEQTSAWFPELAENDLSLQLSESVWVPVSSINSECGTTPQSTHRAVAPRLVGPPYWVSVLATPTLIAEIASALYFMAQAVMTEHNASLHVATFILCVLFLQSKRRVRRSAGERECSLIISMET